MSVEREQLARAELAAAKDTWDDAETLLQSGRYRSAMNRAYYAAFYAARALLAVKGLGSSRHSGVISMVGQHFVKPGILSESAFKSLRRAFAERLKCDYQLPTAPDKSAVEKIVGEGEKFIAEVEGILRREGV